MTEIALEVSVYYTIGPCNYNITKSEKQISKPGPK